MRSAGWEEEGGSKARTWRQGENSENPEGLPETRWTVRTKAAKGTQSGQRFRLMNQSIRHFGLGAVFSDCALTHLTRPETAS